ncbi:MAG: hypothetical protein ABSD45_14430 [Terriglobia bacterium]|jgi:hypothetical protein
MPHTVEIGGPPLKASFATAGIAMLPESPTWRRHSPVWRGGISLLGVFPPSVRARFAEQAGATQGWHCYVSQLDHAIGLDHFGASAPGPVLMREYGLTAENVCKRARALLERNHA